MESILVGMSGGIDSAVAAALLKQQGYKVAAAILVFEGVSCTAVKSARTTAEFLNIPFHVCDVTNDFHGHVVEYFVDEYKNGRTPNPCVRCNQLVKFGMLLEFARKLGMQKIATGHYAQVMYKNGRYLLKRGVDRNEQSYFLYRLNQQQLSCVVMPLGGLTGGEVQSLASDYSLPVVWRQKSQDICFIPDGDYSQYLEEFVRAIPGPIKNSRGDVIGRHKGITSYTCGQRRGIGVSHTRPYYVTGIDVPSNTVYVGSKQDVYHSELIAEDCTFIPFDTLDTTLLVQGKVRYVSTLSRATVIPLEKKRIKVKFKRRQWAPMPGQSVVLYEKNFVIGGGIIERVL